MSRVLITGGAGFVGANAADRLLADGHRVRVLDNLARAGVGDNLQWLQGRHGEALEVVIGDVQDAPTVEQALRGVDSVLHFAAQVAVTTSLEDPLADARDNLLGTLNLLEHVRRRPRPPGVVFTSTNKVYGSLADVELTVREDRYEPASAELREHGIGETRGLDFCTPYGCSKGAADQYVLDWSHSFGVPTVVFRMSCIYGPRQFGTEDQGWVAHFLIRAMAGERLTVFGDGRQVRDILFVEDLVEALELARTNIDTLAGRPFNIGGGPQHSVSLREVMSLIEDACDDSMPAPVHEPWRAGDQRWYVSDPRAFGHATGWMPRTDPRTGIQALHAWLSTRARSAPAPAAR